MTWFYLAGSVGSQKQGMTRFWLSEVIVEGSLFDKLCIIFIKSAGRLFYLTGF